MRSLSLLVLLLFAMVMGSTEQSLAPSPPATSTLMEELLANGGRRRFKSFNELYLTEGVEQPLAAIGAGRIWALPQNSELHQDWTIVQINNNEVAIKSSRSGFYLNHGTNDYADQALVPKEWEMLTPVKNADGTWSFKSRWNKWLSAAHRFVNSNFVNYLHYVNFQPENKKCERWRLEPYTPLANPIMEELLANGGRRRFKSFNGLYLTDEHQSKYPWALRRQEWASNQDWTIVEIGYNRVAIRSIHGSYIGHGTSDWAQKAPVADDWEILTPVKNPNGSWSFTNRWKKWLSAHSYYEPHCYSVSFEYHNQACEHWFLETW